jgi:hypothetical protein
MITTLLAYKEMILASATGKKMNSLPGDLPSAAPAATTTADKGLDAVSVELSASHDVFSAVDNYFNLGRSGRFDAFHKLSPHDKEQFVKIVAELAKSGYMGYEELVVNKKVERHEVLMQIGDERLKNARLYDENK